MVRLIIEWLRDGALPLFAYKGTFWTATVCDDVWAWTEDARHRGRILIPLVEGTLGSFLEFLSKPLPGKGVIVSLRSTFELDGVQYVCVGAAVADATELVEGIEVPPESLAQVVRTVTAFPGQEEPPAEEALRGVWDHYHMGVQWRHLQREAFEHPTEPDEEWFKARWPHPEQYNQTYTILVEDWRNEQTYKAEAEKVDAAKKKALRLLRGCLNEEQRAELDAAQRFRVLGPDGFTYLITYRGHGNVWRMRDQKPVANCCIVPVKGVQSDFKYDAIPIYDLMLAQKLMIEADFEGFLRTANIVEIDPPVE